MVLEGEKKNNHHQTRFAGIIIKKASPGPPSPVSPALPTKSTQAGCLSKAAEVAAASSRASPAPGRGLISVQRTDSPQLPASAPSQRASPWGHPSPRPEENPGCHVHVGAGSPGPADWTGAVTRPQRRQSESLMLLGIGN